MTPQDLDEGHECLHQALRDRQSSFNREKTRVGENDKLSREFASEADPLVSEITDSMFTLLEAKKSLDEQLKYVAERLKWVDSHATRTVAAVEAVASELKKKMVTFNEYTTLSAFDVRLQFSFFKAFLDKKKTALEADIDHKLHKGVSKEQVAEINAIYNEYDKDKSGSIDKKELRAALFSLGEEASKEALDGYEPSLSTTIQSTSDYDFTRACQVYDTIREWINNDGYTIHGDDVGNSRRCRPDRHDYYSIRGSHFNSRRN